MAKATGGVSKLVFIVLKSLVKIGCAADSWLHLASRAATKSRADAQQAMRGRLDAAVEQIPALKGQLEEQVKNIIQVKTDTMRSFEFVMKNLQKIGDAGPDADDGQKDAAQQKAIAMRDTLVEHLQGDESDDGLKAMFEQFDALPLVKSDDSFDSQGAAFTQQCAPKPGDVVTVSHTRGGRPRHTRARVQSLCAGESKDEQLVLSFGPEKDPVQGATISAADLTLVPQMKFEAWNGIDKNQSLEGSFKSRQELEEVGLMHKPAACRPTRCVEQELSAVLLANPDENLLATLVRGQTEGSDSEPEQTPERVAADARESAYKSMMACEASIDPSWAKGNDAYKARPARTLLLFCASVCAAPTLNAAGQSWVTLSLQ